MAKGMGNGFPVAGILIAPHIKAKFGMLGTTFGGNQLACAAALAVLEVMEDESLMDNATQMGHYLQNRLKELPLLENIRGRGLMIGFDLAVDVKNLKSDVIYKERVCTGEAKPNTIRLSPSLTLKKSEADEFIDAVAALLRSSTITENT